MDGVEEALLASCWLCAAAVAEGTLVAILRRGTEKLDMLGFAAYDMQVLRLVDDRERIEERMKFVRS